MKVVRARLAVPAAILAMFFSGVARAEENAPGVSAHELQAKLQYCKTCHGSQGQGYRGATPIPRLAGQQVEYFESQLVAFVEKRRENVFMYGVAHVLSPAMRTALAKHFNGLNPKPFSSAPKELVSEGKKIFEAGIPGTDVPPCASCHGPDAKGSGTFPRLAGQSSDYIQRALLNWDKFRGRDAARPDNSAIMQPITHGLKEPQIKAVAAYLDHLE